MKQIDQNSPIDVERHRVKMRPILIGSLLALLGVASFFITRTLPQPIVHWMLHTGVPAQAEMWIGRMQANLTRLPEIVETGEVTFEEDVFLQAAAQTSDVFSITLIRIDGTVMWSNNHDTAKGSVIDNMGYHEVLTTGEPCYDLVHVPHGGLDHQGFEDPSTHNEESGHAVFHVYYPLIERGQLIGMVHFASDFTSLHDTFIGRIRTGLIAVQAFIVITLLISLTFIYRSARHQERVFQKQADRERKWVDNQISLAREVKLISELNEWLQSSKSLSELFDMVASFMTNLLPDCEGSLYVYSNSRDVLDGSVSWNNGDHRDHIHPDECWGLRRGRPYYYGQSEVNFSCGHVSHNDKRPYYCIPILAHGETIGLLHLRAIEGVSIEQFETSRKLARLTAEQISMAIANVRMRDQLQDQSIRDPLTGLFNRRHLTESLRRLIRRSERNDEPLSIVSIDVDDFKKFNDNHGHDAGDMVLRAVGGVLEQGCNGDEVACRFGGEEFMLLIPKLDQKQMMKRADEVREAVSAIAVRYGERELPHITISVGVAMFPDHGDLPQDLMNAADRALYQAKTQGRNQVVLAKEDGIFPIPANKGDAA